MSSNSYQPPAKKTSKMVKGILVVLALGVATFLSFQAVVYSSRVKEDKAVWGSNEQGIVYSNNWFGLSLYTGLRKKNETPNIFFSPFSISAALTMTMLGAKGKTAQQMFEVLHFDNSLAPEVLHSGFEVLLKELLSKEEGHYLLHLANRVYLQHKYKILDSFKDGTREFYGAESENLDFKSDAEGARKIVNGWVEEMTKDKVKELLKPGVLSDITRFILVNAIYFKGNWEKKFDSKLTRPQNFYINDKEKVQVDMMFQKGHFMNGYNDDLKAQILQLPYSGGQLSMVIVLPTDRTGLSALEDKLTGDVSTITKDLRNSSLEVYLPKFSLTEDYNLKELLQLMGMVDLFSEKEADLSGISGDRDLYVSHVVHKAFLEVNEDGSEAAAATAVVGMERMAARNSFRADHPFYFYIRHEKTGSILFMGRYVQPTNHSSGTGREDL